MAAHCAVMRRLRVVIALLLCSLASSACSQFVQLSVQDIDVDPVPQFAQSFVYAADGSLIATLRFSNREPVVWEDLPESLVQAVVSAEDRRFFEHDGVDPRAIARAWVANRQAGGIVQGGSTITQQLVKNRYFPGAANTLERKTTEAHLAWQLERDTSKQQILTDYLNTVYFGSGAYGIEAAATTYFGMTTADLSVTQSALLAGIIRSPERFSPFNDPVAAAAERRRVAMAMQEEGYLDADGRTAVITAPLGTVAPPEPPATRFPYFVEYVKRTLVSDPEFGYDEPARWQRLFGGGLRIHTSIDPALQAQAEAAATAFWSDPADPEVAIAVVQPTTGAVLATVGGRDFGRSQFDLATQGRRQPGSTFKVFALAAALSRGWRLDSTIESGPGVFDLGGGQTWSVRSGPGGPITLHDALVRSSNGAFARLALDMGPGAVAGMAQTMGITTDIGSNPSIVLGGLTTGVSPLEMAGAFGTLANGGVHATPSPITDITDAEGKVVYRPRMLPRVTMDPETAYLLTSTMVDVINGGTGQLAALDRPAAGKTGTVQGNTDGWFVGFTPELSTAVWIGYPDAVRPLVNIHGEDRVEGGNWPARIWREFMSVALRDVPVRDFAYPDALTRTVQIDPLTGGIATPYCPTTIPLTGLPGELPDFVCPLHTAPPPLPPQSSTAVVPLPPPPAVVYTPAPVPAVTVAPPPSATPVPTPTPTPTPSPTAPPPPPPPPPPGGPGIGGGD